MKDIDIEEYALALRALKKRGQLEEALRSLINTSLGLVERESAFGRVFGSPQLDDAAAMLGVTVKRPNFPRRQRAGVAIIATALYGRGGHTRSLRELLAVEQEQRATVFLTNVGHDLALREIQALLPEGVTVEIAPGDGLAHRMRWLQKRLDAFRPRRTYLFHHPYDAVAVAAAQPELVGKLYFYHHADHGFTLGLHKPTSTHIDPTPKMYYHCRQHERLSENVYWPLTGGVEGVPKGRSNTKRSHKLVTCCAGGIEKFENVAMVDRLPYRISYPEMVATVLAATGGRHLHIGPLGDSMLDQIYQKLASRGVGIGSFIHVREVASLTDEMAEQGVDLYLGSFPRGGGRALVEAMSIGLPMLLHDSYRSALLTDVNEAYDGALSWRTLRDLTSALATLTPGFLAEHRQRSRRRFRERHTRQQFENAVTETLIGGAPPVPPERPHYDDPLQNYVDEQNRIEVENPNSDFLALIRARNEGWRPLGGVRIHDASAEDPLYYGSLPSNHGLYLHAGSKGQATVARISPEDGRMVVGLRAELDMVDKRCPPIEYAVVLVADDTTPDLGKVAAWLSKEHHRPADRYQIVVPWKQKVHRESETLIVDWRERDPVSTLILAVRTLPGTDNHRHAMLSFRDTEWKAAPKWSDSAQRFVRPKRGDGNVYR